MSWSALSGAVPDFLPHSGKVAKQAAGSEEGKTDIIDEQQPGADKGDPEMVLYAQDDQDRDDKEDEKKPW